MFSDHSHLFWAVKTVLTEVLTTSLTFLLFLVRLSVQLSQTAQSEGNSCGVTQQKIQVQRAVQEIAKIFMFFLIGHYTSIKDNLCLAGVGQLNRK